MKVFVTVKFALIPFAVSWALLGARHSALAIWSGLVLSALGNTSIFGPWLAIPYTLKWPLDSQETYHWPAPVFGPDTATGCSVAIDDLRSPPSLPSQLFLHVRRSGCFRWSPP